LEDGSVVKLGAGDFGQSGKLMKSPEELDVWWVCDDYEIQGDRIVAKYAAESFGSTKEYLPYSMPELDRGWKSYRPLEDAPDLFLKFARLQAARDFSGAALAWSRKYGLPIADRHLIRPDGISLRRFRKEVRRAWAILMMYEAALNRDTQAVENLLIEHSQEPIDLWPLEISEERPLAHYENEIQFALYGSIWLVEWVVEDFCRRQLIVEGDQRWPDPTKVKPIYAFLNLLGAMYLQMHWLIASGGNVTRCEHCSRIISHARPHPAGRKSRRDKRFCDDACRQAHHRSKRKRQASES
jgi:hypothetical protein